MKKQLASKNIFADKATLILRKMLRDPDRQWVVRDFNGPQGVSLGLAQQVLETMARQGYAERVKKGPDSYTVLSDAEELIKAWTTAYSLESNEAYTYYTHDEQILKKIKSALKDRAYALTLHTGANLLTSYVKTDHVYLYLDATHWEKDVLSIRQQLDLKELVQGGNIHFIRPFYKTTVFNGKRMVEGYPVVSNLQLFLDLYHFQPRGREHAEFLKEQLEEKGKAIGQ
ncbi:MAG: hypothetical protein HQL22_09675 [Candidatus Omnitrophica bacterium]|nr:hypothetical protein [Candidatus Omnitrophota bacterium]